MELKVTSTAFKNGDWIPERHTAFGGDVSPELILEGMDERAVSLVITLDDAGHPLILNYNHWIAWNIPPVEVIPEAIPRGDKVESPLHVEQGMAYGKHCYRGPNPPFRWNHDYYFTVYVLDIDLQMSTLSTRDDILKAAEGHILQKGILMGKYQHNHK